MNTTVNHTALERVDRINSISAKLCAMLNMTYGEAADAFQAMGSDTQQSYMMACADMADEMRDLLMQHASEAVEVSHG